MIESKGGCFQVITPLKPKCMHKYRLKSTHYPVSKIKVELGLKKGSQHSGIASNFNLALLGPSPTSIQLYIYQGNACFIKPYLYMYPDMSG